MSVPKSEIHLKPVWNALDEPIWIVAAARHSAVSKIVEKSPGFTRQWRDAWGWEIDHSEFKELAARLRTHYTLCPQCLSGVGAECDTATWKLQKIGVRARLADEKKPPREPPPQYGYGPYGPTDEGASWEYDFYGSTPAPSSGMTPEEAASVLGLAWPIEGDAAEKIKKAFGKAALAAHTDVPGSSGSDEKMKKVLDARIVLKEWAGMS